MYVSSLSLVDFRSYPAVDLALPAGPVAFLGPNGEGKTNLVEAVDYAATGGSHRVATDQPLVRHGAERAVVRVTAQRDHREALVEIEINPGRSNRARLNRGQLTRARDVLGVVRTVLFSPTDLGLVKGDPGERRRFLDDLLVARRPKYAGLRADYDRVLRQRNTLLKTAGRGGRAGTVSTLDAWDAHLARTGGEILAERLALVAALQPVTARHYATVSRRGDDAGGSAALAYRSSTELDERTDRFELADVLLEALHARREEELDRGITLVGPHRDDLLLSLGDLPAKGYASHGESWSLALGLRLAAFDLMRSDGDDPVLILDDVFAELDDTRRSRLAEQVAGCEQVLVTAAVPDDVPAELVGQRFEVRRGEVTRA